ncbi:hypothetical protein GALMADRAFT_278676 [Galerina marginata CBS 339.88]|uniref:Uncharacterized protein n=1 Tax=Galerina marginata (strain CBS 339.88) TaxID=685588 RepID=A0A067TCA9_GALM3|nr:hypothetical protein GALMADRAFT_278676 [Galerina marginata CBS 339.88]
MYQTPEPNPQEFPPVKILNSLLPVWDVEVLPDKRSKGLPPVLLNPADPITHKGNIDTAQQSCRIHHSPTLDRFKCLLRPNQPAQRVRPVIPNRDNPALTDYVLDIGPMPASSSTLSLPSSSSSGRKAPRQAKKRPPPLNLQHSSCRSNFFTPSPSQNPVIPDSGVPSPPRSSTPTPLTDVAMALQTSQRRRHSVLQRPRGQSMIGIAPDEVASNHAVAADPFPSPHNVLEVPWGRKPSVDCRRRSSFSSITFADFPIWSAPQSRASTFGKATANPKSTRHKRRSSDPNFQFVEIYDWKNFLPEPVRLSPIVLEGFPDTSLSSSSDSLSLQSSALSKETDPGEVKVDKPLPQTPQCSVEYSSPSDSHHSIHVIGFSLNPYDRDEPGISRKDHRNGWSGEWNQPHIQDVIEKLRDLK